jgi:transposase
VRAVLGLTRVPDHSTISRMLKRLTLARLEAMLNEVLRQLEEKEEVVAIDATGFASPKPALTTPPAAENDTA